MSCKNWFDTDMVYYKYQLLQYTFPKNPGIIKTKILIHQA